MKRFLKKRWHSVPIGILAVVMALVLVAGSAFAWYAVTTGTAEVTVDEAISYEVTGQTDGDFNSETSVWTVSMLAGETEIIYMTVSNTSSAELEVVATYTISPPIAGITVTGNDGIALDIPVFIPGGGSGPFSIEVHAAGDVAVDIFTIEFTLNRR